MTPEKKSKTLWALAALVVGVSVPYFLVDVGSSAYHKMAVNFGFEEKAKTISNLGSEEKSTADDLPQGPDIPVNPAIDGQYYFLGPNYKVPETSAQAYIVADIDTGEIIVEKNSGTAFPIASVSKLMTALVAMHDMNPHEMVTVSRSSVEIYGTAGGLRVGEKILVNDLLYPLLMESSNDAAEVLAEAYGFDEFLKHMNAKAKELGMESTSFAEPSGLSENNASSASDLLKLVEHISKEHPEIWDITRVRQYAILKHSWGNASQLSRKSNFVGGKNGYTDEAHYTTASIFDVPVNGGMRRFAVILLKSNSRENDVNALLSFLSKWVGFLPDGQELNDN